MLATASLVLAASRTRSDPLFWQEWATNCMNLSTYYIANALFGKAQHCLDAATIVLPQDAEQPAQGERSISATPFADDRNFHNVVLQPISILPSASSVWRGWALVRHAPCPFADKQLRRSSWAQGQKNFANKWRAKKIIRAASKRLPRFIHQSQKAMRSRLRTCLRALVISQPATPSRNRSNGDPRDRGGPCSRAPARSQFRRCKGASPFAGP